MILAILHWALWGSIIFGLASTAVVIGTGLHSLRSRTTASATITEFVSHAAGALAIIVGMYYFVPRCVKMFDDFDAELPRITILLMGISHWVVVHFYLLAAPLIVLIVADVAVFFALHKNESTRTYARIWSGCITALIGIGILLWLAAFVVPTLKLLGNLS